MMKACCIVCAVLSLATGAGAVIVNGEDGTQNTDGTGVGGWSNVGRITGAAPSSVTYIDNNWFITAYHVQALDSPTGVLLGGSTYSIDAGSWTRLQNTSGGDADLAMFRVTGGTVGLSGLTVRSSHLPNNSPLTMIGNGHNRETDKTYWDASWNETIEPGVYSGYESDTSGTTKRWGTNEKESTELQVDSGFGITDVFYTDFDDAGDSEAQGAIYDSGGGVFYGTGSELELAGIMVTVGGFTSGQPDARYNHAFGNRTYIANMQDYADQINATTAIPEPSVLMLGSVFAIAGFCIRRVFMI